MEICDQISTILCYYTCGIGITMSNKDVNKQQKREHPMHSRFL